MTPEMLRWIKAAANTSQGEASDVFDAAVIRAAVTTAWFFMLRAKEYCDSNGIDYAVILRGVDVKFIFEEVDGIQTVIGVTIQFRKTKTDQEAYGACKTMYRSGDPDSCVVAALEELNALHSCT